jgi:uncharacterized membrane protein
METSRALRKVHGGWRASSARRFSGHFARGIAIVLPVVATCWLLAWLFLRIDGLLPSEDLFGRRIRGLGIAIVLALALLVGLLTSRKPARLAVERLEAVLLRIPIFKLVYSAFRDFANALFVKKRFDKPVLVRIGAGVDAEVIGFVTRQNLDALGIKDKVAVYLPLAYNLGGNMVLVPRERLTPLDADSSLVMSFVLTGGVANAEPATEPSPALASPTVPALECRAAEG